MKPLLADYKNKNSAVKAEVEFHTEPTREEAPIKVKKSGIGQKKLLPRNWIQKSIEQETEK